MANDSPDWTAPGGGAAVQRIIDTITVAAGGSVNHLSVAVPLGTQSIGFLIESVNANPSQILVTGNQSSAQYINALNFFHLGPQWFPFTAKDSTLLIQVTALAGNGCTVDFLTSPQVESYANDNSTPAPVVPRPFDVNEDSGLPAGGVLASCVAPATPGLRYVCGLVTAEISAGAGAAAAVVALRLWDGPSGSSLLKGWRIGQTTVVGSSDRISLPGLAIGGTRGNAMTLDFSASVTNGFEQCGFSAWGE